jgi:hypothetical protein
MKCIRDSCVKSQVNRSIDVVECNKGWKYVGSETTCETDSETYNETFDETCMK